MPNFTQPAHPYSIRHPYLNAPVVIMLLFGFAAGLPFLLIFSSLGLWLREAGIDRATVTMFSWAALGYSFKFIWAPLVDILPLPLLRSLGRRRSWLLAAQILIIIALILMAMTNPANPNLLNVMAFGAVLLGFASATQDIVIDAYRIEIAPTDMQPTLSASYVAGYRIGMIASGAGALYLAEYFGSTTENYNYLAWQKTYLIMAVVMGIGVITTLFARESKPNITTTNTKSSSDHLRLVLVFILSIIAFVISYRLLGVILPKPEQPLVVFLTAAMRFLLSLVAFAAVAMLSVKFGVATHQSVYHAWVSPIQNFFERYGKQAALLLALIGLYRVSDIIAGNISNIFYQDLGFSKTQIADAVKVVGMIATIIGGFSGGALAQKLSITKALSIGAILACSTNLLFIWLSHTPTVPMMYMAVISDNFASGLASAVFIGFLSALTSIRFTAVQYALFSSLMTLAPKLLGGYSGAIVDASSYTVFFGFTFVIGLPVLYLIYLVNKHIDLTVPQSEQNT